MMMMRGRERGGSFIGLANAARRTRHMELNELAFKDDESIVRGLDETVVCLHGVGIHCCKSRLLDRGDRWWEGCQEVQRVRWGMWSEGKVQKS